MLILMSSRFLLIKLSNFISGTFTYSNLKRFISMTKCEVLLSFEKLFVSFGQKHKENSSILIARKRWSYVRICPIIELQNANIDKRLTGHINFPKCDWFSEWWHWCDALCVYYCWRQLRLSTVVFFYSTVYSIKFSCSLAVCRLVNIKLHCLRCGCRRR